jgi:thiol-disulfide isomerase/thioredoxin
MRTTLLTLATATVLALSACGSDDRQTSAPAVDGPATADAQMYDEPMTEEPMAEDLTEDMDDEAMTDEPMAEDMTAAGAYVDLATYRADPAAYEGSRVVLFFHADWCPSCRATDAALVEDGVPEGLTVVQVDFDTETELRQEHGVVQQHTFVHVDADGTALATWSGSVDGEDILARTG